MSKEWDYQPLVDKYHAETEKIDNGKGYWNSLQVKIIRTADGEELGQYKRPYPSLFNTFHPFLKDGKEYALISEEYVTFKVLELPSCKVVAKEESEFMGFCPTDFFVPHEDPEAGSDFKDGLTSQFGFIAGCYWGDDSSWKIQYLDLSDLEKGVVRRSDKFGYIHLPEGVSLSQAISLTDYFVGSYHTNRKGMGADENGMVHVNDRRISIATSYVFDLEMEDVEMEIDPYKFCFKREKPEEDDD